MTMPFELDVAVASLSHIVHAAVSFRPVRLVAAFNRATTSTIRLQPRFGAVFPPLVHVVRAAEPLCVMGLVAPIDGAGLLWLIIVPISIFASRVIVANTYTRRSVSPFRLRRW